uniref:Ig-like domain-containing protein n=1 Tax=Salvator merianae TaxID=96440 RepID=A0A8D0DLH5_SALMN
MDPLWLMKTPASFMATVTVLVLVLFCQGTLSQSSSYTLMVPPSVSVQQGLCIDIPCSFTYDQQKYQPYKLYGYWLKNEGEEKTYFSYSRPLVNGRLVATSDENLRVHSSTANRFRFTGNPDQGSCSFRINDAALQDRGTYYFRTEDRNDLRYSYQPLLQVLVTELTQKPEIQNSTEITWGKEVTFTCRAPGTCSGTPPRFTWTTALESRQRWPNNYQHRNGSWTYTSELTLKVTLTDQGKPLTCRVEYPAVGATVESTTYLPCRPRNMKINVSITSPGKPESSSHEKDLVAQEGDTVNLLCQVEATPEPTMTWMKANKSLDSPVKGTQHWFNLSKIRPEDAGEYYCHAENWLGSNSKVIRLNVHCKK